MRPESNLCTDVVVYLRMEIVSWFGKTDKEVDAFLSVDEMIDALLKQNACACSLPQPDMRTLARSSGFALTDQEYNARLRTVALGLVRRKLVALATAEQDLLQAVEALDDLFSAINLLDERLYEWSRLHRQEIVHGKDLAEILSQDKIMGELARTILSLREAKRMVEFEVSASVECLAPNLSCLSGSVLAARLISRAGGLHHLAEMPSSRVQIMGAEKSLFKHLKGHAPSPKHGIIYRHPAVIGAPKRLRGKVSRALAGKLAIAARLDFFGQGLSPDLMTSLEKRLTDIRLRGKMPTKGKS
jgi:nucleolar protein 56